jgi:hypothetical protein
MVVPTKLITPEIHVEPHVQVPQGAKKVSLTVRTELRNDSEHDVVLHAPDRDAEIFWHVLDEQHRELLRERPPKGDKMPKGVASFRSVTVASGHAEHDNETLEIDARELEDGHTYTVRAEIYGQIAEAEFVVFVAPEPEHAGRATAGGKAAKKKTTKEAKSSRKTAKKATSSKKAAKKATSSKKAGKKAKSKAAGKTGEKATRKASK